MINCNRCCSIYYYGYEPFSVPLTKALHNRRLTKWRNIDEIDYPLLKAKDLVIPDFKLIEQDKNNLFSTL